MFILFPNPPIEISPAEVFVIHIVVKISMSDQQIWHHQVIIESDSCNPINWSNKNNEGPWNLAFTSILS